MTGRHVLGATGVSAVASGDGAWVGTGAAGGVTAAGVPAIAFLPQYDADACSAALATYALMVAYYFNALWELQAALAAPPVAGFLYANVLLAGAAVIVAGLTVDAACQ